MALVIEIVGSFSGPWFCSTIIRKIPCLDSLSLFGAISYDSGQDQSGARSVRMGKGQLSHDSNSIPNTNHIKMFSIS
ncbi:hypothetical protein SLEP1_g11769 [Rubroshorea leprosula]|nr:hypothetical protein SLEP1_g11769 [Rubroshorea leprosula]